MATEADREGNFKCQIIEYGVKKMDSGAVGVTLKVRLMAHYNFETEEWVPWSEYDMEAWGTVWVIKKDGKLNKIGAESLIEHAGWDGYLESIVEHRWEPTDCQVSLKENTYEGKTTYPINYVNALDRVPGQLGNVDTDEAKSLDTQYGSALRAIAGTVRANKSAPANGKPPAPPKRELAGSTIDPATGKEVPF